jgi:hypothetical protein
MASTSHNNNTSNTKTIYFRNKIINEDNSDESNNNNHHHLSWRKKLHDLLLTSTSHGLPNALRTPHTSMRVMWLLCFVASTGVCSYLIIKSFLAYLDYEVITKVRVVNEFQSEFPRILICNLNQFTTNKSLEFLSDKRFNDNLNNNGGGDGGEDDLRERRYNRAMQYASYALNDSEKRALSFDIKDILVSFNSYWRFSCFLFMVDFH